MTCFSLKTGHVIKIHTSNNQCCAIHVGFELHIVIESNISISNIGFYFDSGEFCHNFHSIPIPIIHSGMYFNLPAISAKLNQVVLPFDI